jgi:putative transposase
VILELISEAQASRARLAPACRMVGISARTIERWRADHEAGDRRCGPHRRPSNALSPAEEARVVTVLTSSRYAGLSPKQLVPQLADEGLYLASESTMYRVQRRHGLRTKKRTTARIHVARASTVHQATGPNQV